MKRCASIICCSLIAISVAACSPRPTPPAPIPGAAPPSTAAAGAPPSGGGAPGAGASGAPTAPPLPPRPPTTSGAYQGGAREDAVVSSFPCTTGSDCTSTTFMNIPRSKNDCQCQAPCIPSVVNAGEAAARETANKAHCTNDDWFGPECPAPDCPFVEFEAFRCVEGKCVGIDVLD